MKINCVATKRVGSKKKERKKRKARGSWLTAQRKTLSGGEKEAVESPGIRFPEAMKGPEGVYNGNTIDGDRPKHRIIIFQLTWPPRPSPLDPTSRPNPSAKDAHFLFATRRQLYLLF